MTTYRGVYSASVAGLVGAAALLLSVAPECGAQPKKAAPAATAFEAVSFKYGGPLGDLLRPAPGGGLVFHQRPLEFKGNRLSGDATIHQIINFACLPLVTPYQQEPTGRGIPIEIYQIDAVAPSGTTLDGARAMLRTVLSERIGFRYHIADRETPVFYLVRGSGALKLKPSTEPDPPGLHRGGTWLFQSKSQTVSAFARFLSSVAGRDVIDKTGIQGNYQFNVDWMRYLNEEGPGIGPDLAISGAKSLGLKLQPGKETRKVLVIDHVNKMPTPN